MSSLGRQRRAPTMYKLHASESYLGALGSNRQPRESGIDKMKKESSYFDTWSTELYGSDLIFQRTIHSFTEGVVRGDTLDIECGSRILYNVSGVTRWVGLDVSQAMLNDLRFYGSSRPTQVETILTSCLDAEFPAGSFDTVCAIFVLHHLAQESTGLSRDRVGAMMRKALRYLRPGGRFLIAENAAKALEWPYHRAYRPLYWIFRQSKAIELPHFGLLDSCSTCSARRDSTILFLYICPSGSASQIQ